MSTVVWAEMNLVVADQFRDGNVLAHYEPLPVAQAAFAALSRDLNRTQFWSFLSDTTC